MNDRNGRKSGEQSETMLIKYKLNKLDGPRGADKKRHEKNGREDCALTHYVSMSCWSIVMLLQQA